MQSVYWHVFPVSLSRHKFNVHSLVFLQVKERSQLEAQLAEAEQRLEAVQKERAEQEEHLSAATDRVEGAPVCVVHGPGWEVMHWVEADWLCRGCPAVDLFTLRKQCATLVE